MNHFDLLNLDNTIEGEDTLLDINSELTDEIINEVQNYFMNCAPEIETVNAKQPFVKIAYPPLEDVHYLWTKPAPRKKKANKKKKSHHKSNNRKRKLKHKLLCHIST